VNTPGPIKAHPEEPHLDLSDPRLRQAGAEILARHNTDEHEHNTGVAIREFITATGLAQPSEIQMEAASGNRGRVDLSIDSHRLYIEVKTQQNRYYTPPDPPKQDLSAEMREPGAPPMSVITSLPAAHHPLVAMVPIAMSTTSTPKPKTAKAMLAPIPAKNPNRNGLRSLTSNV